MELVWDGLFDFIKTYLAEADEHLYIMSPFITKGVLVKILPDDISSTIITSWRPDFLIKSPNSIDVFLECKERGNTALYINNRLHAKLYAYDLTKKKNGAILGSVNLTRKGLGIDPKSNYEIACILSKLRQEDQIYFQRILNDSILVTDDIYELYNDRIINRIKDYSNLGDLDIDSLSKPQLLVTHLPLTDSPSRLWKLKNNEVEFKWWEEDALVHDISIFEEKNTDTKNQFMEELKKTFKEQSFVKEFLSIIDTDGMYFGHIKEWIQNNCYDVPTPKRRELTITVQALLKWIVELYPRQYEIVRPIHSECLREIS